MLDFACHSLCAVWVALVRPSHLPSFDKWVVVAGLRGLAADGALAAIKAQMHAGKHADDDQSETGSTPLMMAASNGKTDVIKYLIEHGANINAQNDKTDKGQKCTALHFAVLNKHAGAAKLLASLGAKTDIAMKDGKTVDDLVAEVTSAMAWSKSLSSTRGLKLSDDSKTVTKTDNGPDYETALSEHVLSSGVTEVSFTMSRRVRAVKIGCCLDGFSETGRDIQDVSGGYIVYKDGGTIMNRLGGKRDESSWESYDTGDKVSMTVDFDSHSITFKKAKKTRHSTRQ